MKGSKVILTAIQSTGNIHLGNYLGCIKNLVSLQNIPEDKSLYCMIADLHALTNLFQIDHDVHFETNLYKQTLQMTAYLIASGLDPKSSCLFVQSLVPEHVELQWILSCIAPMNWLNLMTQYKDKKTKSSSLGLFSYPVLMASDILLYKADIVPVGQDQKQHLELTKDYAKRFNLLFSTKQKPYFNIPEYFQSSYQNIAPTSKVMSLRDGNKKMSKSEHSDFSRINLSDDPELIFEKIMKSKTDSLLSIQHDPTNRPEISNLINIYGYLAGQSILEVQKKYENRTIKDFKSDLAELIIKEIYPIHLKAQDLLLNNDYLHTVIKENSQKARQRANIHLQEIKKLVGLYQ